MKLVSVKILGKDFRSLSSNKLYEFNITHRKDRLSTKVFAGLNGSGKSNFLELLAEIFYYLEVYHLKSATSTQKKEQDFGFEIEYLLPKTKADIKDLFEDDFKISEEAYIKSNSSLPNFENQKDQDIQKIRVTELEKFSSQFIKDNFVHIRIVKPIQIANPIQIKNPIEIEKEIQKEKQIDNKPEFYILAQDGVYYAKSIKFRTIDFLPTKIIAYTSGQNELLSNPFFKSRYHYFKEAAKINLSKEELNTENERLFFLDNSSNFSIFISNMLLATPEKLKYLKEIFKVEDLHSFRITINYVDYKKNKIKLNEKDNNTIIKLKQCASTWIHRAKGKEDFLILDYTVNEAMHDAFRFHFNTPFELFQAFYALENLNLHLVAPDTRSHILRAHKTFNFTDELPKPDPSRLIFRIEKIVLNKIIEEGKPAKQIYYKGLSDGEHQFNEVIGSVMMMEQDGCLFLMDEPDTHFNPKWRAKMIEMLNHVTAYTFDSKGKPEAIRKQEIIITTHSPFVISDSQSEDVYKFDKKNSEVTYINPKIETYGASVTLILQEIFGRKISISDLSNNDLEELRKEFKEIKTPDEMKAKIEVAKSKLLNFGESIEKFDLYSLLRHLEKEFENKK